MNTKPNKCISNTYMPSAVTVIQFIAIKPQCQSLLPSCLFLQCFVSNHCQIRTTPRKMMSSPPLLKAQRHKVFTHKVTIDRSSKKHDTTTHPEVHCWISTPIRHWRTYMGVSENSGFSPQIIHFNRVFHYKPSILGYPYFWKHPKLILSFRCFMSLVSMTFAFFSRLKRIRSCHAIQIHCSDDMNEYKYLLICIFMS